MTAPQPEKAGRASLWAGWRCLVLLGIAGLLLAGCAVRSPLGEPLAGGERLGIEVAFLAAMAERREQLLCLDAEAELNWRTLLRSGILPGYLQALSPGQLKFVGLDPLGRPLLALVTDGDFFRLVLVPETRVYEGATTAASFRRHLPDGLTPEILPQSLFALLSGGQPFNSDIVAVYQDPHGEGYWLEVAEPTRTQLLFGPGAAADGENGGRSNLVRRIRLYEPGDRQPTEIVYGDYRPAALPAAGESLLLPHRIELHARRHQGLSLTLRLDDLLTDCGLSAADFQLPVPGSFTRELIQ